jgi:hypothetical protein
MNSEGLPNELMRRTRSVDAADIGHLCPRAEGVSGVRLATEARYIREAPR